MRLRLPLSLLLCMALAFTSLTMAQTRGAMAATGQMVICTGQGTSVVYVDADGQPTAVPHHCPDCLMLLAPAPVASPLKPIAQAFPLPRRVHPTQTHHHRAPGLTPPSRAPPLAV